MAGMCCGVVGETKTPTTVESSGGGHGKRRRMEIQQLKLFAAAVMMPLPESNSKRRKVKGTENVLHSSGTSPEDCRFGLTVVCGRRRDLEDAVSVKPSFCKTNSDDLHFYGVYDGHGCSHVAMKCKDRMHEIVKEEVESCGKSIEWKETMVKSFSRMDKDVTEWSSGASSSDCRCELQTPQCDAVGSTAVVAVVSPDKIVVSNCGDSRAVLCRNGVAIPLSTDHKPDRTDELKRIEDAGGRVIYWDGARVLGVLAMSRAIGDNYLKPFVIPEPEVTITDRSDEDECLILASDGLWDVVSNDVACSVARMCLSSQEVPSPPRSPGSVLNVARGESSDKACSDASILLTKLALARRTGTHKADYVFQRLDEIRDGGLLRIRRADEKLWVYLRKNPITENVLQNLCKATNINTIEIGGATILLQLWAWERILSMASRSFQQIDWNKSYGVRSRTVLYTSNPTHIDKNPHVFPNDGGGVQMLMNGMSQVYQISNENPVRDLAGRYMKYANARHHMSYQPTYESQSVGAQVPPMTQRVRRRGRGANVGQTNPTDQMVYRPTMPSHNTHVGESSQFNIPNFDLLGSPCAFDDMQMGGSSSHFDPTPQVDFTSPAFQMPFYNNLDSHEPPPQPDQMAYTHANQPTGFIPNRRSVHQQSVRKWAILDDESENWSKNVEEFFVNEDSPFCYSGVFNTPLQLDRRFWGTLLGYTCSGYLTPEHIEGWVGRMMQWRRRQQQNEASMLTGKPMNVTGDFQNWCVAYRRYMADQMYFWRCLPRPGDV
ncbi:hypothetical protein E3N88_03253 [Mikania micrantha]|uniref:protein-serine/threonine phosphatase n=1 Tax=Mikania micrantha TaxID=192012 RepID=A0A5N6Q8L9_9ASTR|nr:hypothetical protein E3N88_03253 [Mikania micrantha]